MPRTKSARCVHCLKVTDSREKDHVLADSWYPANTPASVQRWTVPSCPPCNRNFGRLEQDLLIRMWLSLDPHSDAALGLDQRVYAALGIEVHALSPDEKKIRDGLRAKIRSEFIPQAEVVMMPGRIPGLGPGPDEPQGPGILIPWAELAMIAEKIARGCEYRYRNRRRYVESPYGLRVLVSDRPHTDDPLCRFGRLLNFGPGFQISRAFVTDDPQIVMYWATIWDALRFKVVIDLKDHLIEADKCRAKPGGVLPSPDGDAMRVPDYLRKFSANQDEHVARRYQEILDLVATHMK